MLKAAVIGAGNIGSFHVRELQNAGAEVAAILGSSRQSAEKTASDLSARYGVNPKPYEKLEEMLGSERLDAVSICTPPDLHYAQTKKCLRAGLHVLCEKPFVAETKTNNCGLARELVDLAKRQNKIICVNTQWPAIIDFIKERVDISNLTNFTVHTQPGSPGDGMLPDHLPHANSILVRLIPDGQAGRIEFLKNGPDHIKISFLYANNNISCRVIYEFVYKNNRPRDVEFIFNGKKFKRELGDGYRQKLATDDAVFDIPDPLQVSIRRFVLAAEGKGTPLVSPKEIIENVELQDLLVSAYYKRFNLRYE